MTKNKTLHCLFHFWNIFWPRIFFWKKSGELPDGSMPDQNPKDFLKNLAYRKSYESFSKKPCKKHDFPFWTSLHSKKAPKRGKNLCKNTKFLTPTVIPVVTPFWDPWKITEKKHVSKVRWPHPELDMRWFLEKKVDFKRAHSRLWKKGLRRLPISPDQWYIDFWT